ncbi:hypothetical protein O0L34_g12018 [Tuta absoluta]|nr:hypothetical protein O0L34_g12018 [Tuta absoluta]
MSSETGETHVKSVTVDVGEIPKENAPNSDKTCDSGLETSVSCSDTLSTLPTDGESSPELAEKQVLADLNTDSNCVSDIDTNRSLTTSSSISPDINTSDYLLNLDEFPADKNDPVSTLSNFILEYDNNFSLEEQNSDLIANQSIENSEKHSNIDQKSLAIVSTAADTVMEEQNPVNTNINKETDILNDKSQDNNEELHDLIATNKAVDSIYTQNEIDRKITPELSPEKIQEASSNVNLRTSTASLNEQNTDTPNTISAISKSTYSRSADNISLIHIETDTEKPNLNTEKILNEFVNQKTKASAVQKLTPEIVKNNSVIHNLDGKYSRIPKELLQPDLGSLVKNVHGIFSSMSGSLKYAYNQTQKAPKPNVKNVIRPIPNGKLMDDIFEDNSEKTVPTVKPNVEEKFDKSTSVNPNIHIDEKGENAMNLNVDGKESSDYCKEDVYKFQIESLKNMLAEQRKENMILQERVREQGEELHNRDQSVKEMEVKLDMMSKRAEQADREKDAAVMRYASVECAAIEAKRAAEKAQLAEKQALAEMELMSNKLKSAWSEKQRICQLYDDKCHELSSNAHELAKVREDQKELEGRLKWTQSKLRMEMDAYKECSERADKLSQHVSELETAKDAALANASELAKAKQLEQELKESQAALILCRHEREDLERRLSSTAQHLDTCRRERDVANSALSSATKEVERLKECNLHLEEEAAELAALRAQAALADTLSAQLQRESERATLAEEALTLERARAETCALREAAALQHAATLTAQHVAQRAQSNHSSNKAQALEVENVSLRERISGLEQEVAKLQTSLSEECDRRSKETRQLARKVLEWNFAKLQTSLSEECDRRSKETRQLARKVAEITEEAAEANKKLEWEAGENAVLKKKHANAIKELNRELHRALKRCEMLEAKLTAPEASNRTGSISSLSSGESVAPSSEQSVQNGHSPDSLPDIQVREPDRQALIERIVSLQRAAARRAERCEFLEEHSRQLTAELRGKARLLRHLLCSLPAGAVASSERDAHKKEIARLGGGAMAAVWGGEATGMTLELSLEMNNKLQAVLEDALLKNITLKENMDTLGEEIARLKGQMNSENKS